MKNTTLLAAALLAVLAKADAQIVLEEDWLMSAGFSLTLHEADYSDSEGNLAKLGADQEWQFSNLGVTDTVELEARPAEFGVLADSFPTADLVFTSTAEEGIFSTGTESYMVKDGDDLLVQGFALPIAFSSSPVLRLSDPLTFQSTPIIFGTTGEDRSGVRATYGIEVLGDSTLADVADSIGIAFGQDVDYVVDGWGTLNLGGRSYEALRLSSTTASQQTVEVKVPILGWIDATPFLPDSLLPPVQLLQEHVNWLVQEYSYPIVQVTLDSLGAAARISYASDAVGAFGNAWTPTAELRVAQLGNALLIRLQSELEGAATLHLYGADGRELRQMSTQISDASVRFDIHDLPRGAAVVALRNARGHLMAREPLVLR